MMIDPHFIFFLQYHVMQEKLFMIEQVFCYNFEQKVDFYLTDLLMRKHYQIYFLTFFRIYLFFLFVYYFFNPKKFENFGLNFIFRNNLVCLKILNHFFNFLFLIQNQNIMTLLVILKQLIFNHIHNNNFNLYSFLFILTQEFKVQNSRLLFF